MKMVGMVRGEFVRRESAIQMKMRSPAALLACRQTASVVVVAVVVVVVVAAVAVV